MENLRLRGRPEEELGVAGKPISGLGASLRAWRRYRGLSVKDLAVQIGLGGNGRSYISQIEHGYIQHLGGERLERMASALGLAPEDLISHKMPPSQPIPSQARPRFVASSAKPSLIPDDGLLEYTDPESETAQIGRWRPVLDRYRVTILGLRDVPADGAQIEVNGRRWVVSELDDGEQVVPQTIFRRVEALQEEGVPFTWWLWAEHHLPSAQHQFSCHTLLIGVIGTTDKSGLWCLLGKWLR